MMRTLLTAAIVILAFSGMPRAQAVATKPDTAVDQVFARWTASTPGCAVGVAVGGKPVLLKAYGMADLEHDVRNTPDTIFEAGSVSKQFTALAVQLLASEGKLSIDDPVRQYIPELPDYKVPLTIRHMLTHTSGLRDWGSVASIAGWPRTTREYTHAHVLDIVSRQKSLNFTPGDFYSYSNTGYNLAAMIVSRVSGMSFAEFSKQRIFGPLGLTNTSWRDDHTRIVKGRAIAYEERGGEFHIEMPFENVYGNGGLLTTVGDLLKWNENFVSPRVGSAKLLEEMYTVGKFNDGKPQAYGLGLMVGSFQAMTNISHSGSTAGYRAHLNRFPKSHTSVAVLCNVSSGDATRAANTVSVAYLPQPTIVNRRSDEPVMPDRPQFSNPPLPTYAGEYWSDEAETTLAAKVESGVLVLRRRPDAVIKLEEIDKDTFRGSIGTVYFVRNPGGAIAFLSIKQERVWDLRFAKK